MSRRVRWSPILVVGLAGFAVALSIWAFVFKVSRRMPDLEVYWNAGGRAAAAEPLYRVEDEHFQFKYFPAFAILAIPLGALPLPVAKAFWFFTSIGLLVVLLALVPRLLIERRKSTALLVAITFFVLGKFYVHELALGQVNILLAVIATCAMLAMKTRREAAAGLLVALTIVIKPYAVILVPWLVARRNRWSVLAVMAGAAAAFVLPAVRYGFAQTVALHRDWWRTVTDTTAPNLMTVDNVSLASVYARGLGQGSLATFMALATAAALLAAAAFVFSRRRGILFPEGLEAGLLLTLIPLLSPQGWDYVFLLSTPAVIYLANYEDRLPRLLRAVTIAASVIVGLTVFDLLGRTVYLEFMRLSGVPLCFLVVITALCFLRREGIA
jgi:hypothetical protein